MSEQRKSNESFWVKRLLQLPDQLCRASMTERKSQLGSLGVTARASTCQLTNSHGSFKSQIRGHLLPEGFSSLRPAPRLSESLLGLSPSTHLLLGTVFYLLVCLLIPEGCCVLLISVPITQLCARHVLKNE